MARVDSSGRQSQTDVFSFIKVPSVRSFKSQFLDPHEQLLPAFPVSSSNPSKRRKDPQLFSLNGKKRLQIIKTYTSSMAAAPRMAVMQHHLPSQDSSASASYTYFTPPETLLTPSETMLDASQTGFDTDPRASDVRLPGLTLSDEACLIDIDPVWQNLRPATNQSTTGDSGLGRFMEKENNWAADSISQINILDRHPRES